MSTLAERLNETMEERGLKKSELARLSGVKSPSTLTDLTHGRRSESPQLGKIANALGVEVMWLQFGRGPKYIDRKQEQYSDEDIRIAQLMHGLSVSRKAAVEQIIVGFLSLEQAEFIAQTMRIDAQNQSAG